MDFYGIIINLFSRYVCLLLVLKTGSQQPRLTKVCFIYINKDHILICILFEVIEALVQLVNEPEPEHPLRQDIAEEYSKDKKKFMKNAEEFTKKNAEKRPAD